jgi:hypothetical protein
MSFFSDADAADYDERGCRSRHLFDIDAILCFCDIYAASSYDGAPLIICRRLRESHDAPTFTSIYEPITPHDIDATRVSRR